MRMRTAGIFMLVVLALPQLAAAQTAVAQAAAAERHSMLTVRSKALLEKAPDPTLTNGIATPDAKFTFAAGPDGKEAKVQIGVQSGAWTTGLSFKGKLDAGGDTALVGLTGLSAGATAGVAVSYSQWHPKPDQDRVNEICGAFAARRTTMRATAAAAPCTVGEMSSDPDLLRESALAVDWNLPLIVSAKYEMGRSSYDFVDAKTGAPQPAALRTPIAASGSVGTIFENGTAVAFTVERQRNYKAGKGAQLCTDLATGIRTCDDVVLGAPLTSDATVASLSLQKSGKSLGVQPRLAYRWTKSGHTTSVDVPIYVLQNKDGGLNGGVSLGWRTKDGVRAVLFVGVMTDLFQRK